MAVLNGKYRVKNAQNSYDIIHLETNANQVKFDDGATFQDKLNDGTLKGDKGDRGIQGIQGIQGVKGDKGDKGDTGATGAKGDKGDKGDKGQDGLTTSITVGSTKYTHSNGNITLPSYPTLSSLGAAPSSHSHSEYINQNAFSNVKVGTTTVVADSATDTIEFKAGSNILLTPDATNDAITIAVNGLTVTSSEKTTWNNKETTSGSQSKADAALASAKSYTDTKVANLVGSAPEALDTLQELAAAVQGNEAGVTDLLQQVGTKAEKSYVDTELAKKANSSHTHTGSQVTLTGYSKPSSTSAISTSDSLNAAIGKIEKALDGKQAAGSYASSSHNHDSAYKAASYVPAWGEITGKPSTFAPAAHNQASNTITAMTGYAKASAVAAISTTDSLNTAIGKLEKALDSKQAAGSYAPASHTSDTTVHITAAERTAWNAKSNLALGTTSSTAFRGDYGNTAYTHSQAAHAPSNAQKNSDITKAEIEAKLTGAITSHTHNYAAASHTHDSLNAIDLSNKTVSLNDYNLSSGSPKVAYYICPTDGGGANITGRPNDSSKQAFSLRVEVLRFASTTDYITKQTYIQGSQKIIYVRYCTNGTWTSWEKVYTSAQKPTPSEIGAAASSHTHNYAGSSSAGGAATSANKVNTNLIVKLNGGSTEGTNLFTFNGSAAKTVNITPSSIGATRKYAANIGDGTNATIKVTHNLGTEDITVSVIEVSTKQIVFADIQIVDTNSINILFNSAPTSAQYRVVVIG